MRKNRKLLLKYLLLVSVLMLMMLLCACRVRLTNNTEVASTIEDEDGWLSEDYQMRRDLLGEPVAERPIFKGFESEDDTEDYSDMDYEPLDYDQGTIDEWDEPDDTSSSTNTNSNSGSNSGNRNNNGSSSGEEDEPEIETVTVSIDLNDGEGVVNTMEVEKGSLFGDINIDFATAPEGYSFNGWHTEKDKDSPVDPEAAITEDCTIYAHWKKLAKPDYKVTWEYDDDVEVKNADKLPKIIKGGKYPDKLPVAHKKDYRFLGWYDGKAYITAGQECTGDARLVAKFSSWEQIYNKANPAEDKLQLYTGDPDIIPSDIKEGLVRGALWDAETSPPDSAPAFVIILIPDDTYSEETARKAAVNKRKENAEKYKSSKIVVLPKSATDGSNQLYYRLVLHSIMYGGLEGIDSAAADTEAARSDYYVDEPA